MKKLIAQITLSLFVFATATSAQTVAPNALPASVGARVGVAAGVKGSVQLARNGGVGTVVSSGEEIYLGDKISTDAKGGLQILLLDQTTFTIGANSAIVVDQFIYDPSTDAGKVSVRVVEGTFRFITGKIAHKNPENMQVDLPNGTIGVRGTMVMGNVNGTRSLAILTGPGDKNNTGSRHGAIIVGGKGGDNSKSVSISKTGFGTEITGDGAPKTPFKVPQSQLDQMTSELSPQSSEDAKGEEKSDSASGDDQSSDSASDSSGEESVGSEESATEQAGQGDAETGKDIVTLENIGEDGETVKEAAPPDETQPHPDCDPSDYACFENFAEENFALSDEDLAALLAELEEYFEETYGYVNFTTIDELDVLRAAGTVSAGLAHFSASGDLYDSAWDDAGDFDVFFDINFNNRTVGGGNSKIAGQATNGYAGTLGLPNGAPFQFNLGSQSFDAGVDGYASYQFLGVTDSLACSANCSADVYIDLVNNSQIADGAVIYAELADTGHTAADIYVAVEAPRTDGALS